MDTIDELLRAGVTAVKSGQKEKARQLLLQVIEADDKNERAWLWLSGAVEADEEKRICLENVLTINPDNELARKGLAKLAPSPLDEVVLPGTLEARAAQLTNNEPEGNAGWWVATKVETPLVEQQAKKFDDVWSGNDELCAYCAHPVTGISDRCPQCHHKLAAKVLLNFNPSPYHSRMIWMLIIYLFLRTGVIVAFMNQMDVILTVEFDFPLVLALFTLLPLIGAVIAAYLRQFWSYRYLLIAFIFVTIQTALNDIPKLVSQIKEIQQLISDVGWSNFLTVLGRQGSPWQLLYALVYVPLVILFLIPLLYSIYMAGGDFKQHTVRRIAAVSDRLKDPVKLDRAAQKLAKEGLWGSAVLHWQRAVGRASGHAPYLLRLGQAYAKLGFYERSLDVLKPALESSRKPEVRQQIEKEIVQVTRLSNQ